MKSRQKHPDFEKICIFFNKNQDKSVLIWYIYVIICINIQKCLHTFGKLIGR